MQTTNRQSNMGGGVYSKLIGRLLILQKSLQRYKGVNASKRQTINQAISPMYLQPLSTMELMVLSEMKVA